MVIQRWQSVMLLMAGILMGIFSFSTIGQIQAPDYTFAVSALGIAREGVATAAGEATGISTWATFVVALLSMILPLIGIFCFKNTTLQKKVVLISVLFTIAVCFLVGWHAYSFAGAFSGSMDWNYSMLAVPVIALIAEIKAWSLIMRDERTLRAANRLR
ncbi:MAG: DUF4293 domain-containing protein [Muribaculaceae bacterium]|nr:DUF4293 domain-containing protein [Muribaculaceae bacterium]